MLIKPSFETLQSGDEEKSAAAAATPSKTTTTTDLASLVQTHFSRAERVSGVGECEACGDGAAGGGGSKGDNDGGVRERRLNIRQLSPNVLICLNLFSFNRDTQACHKIMRPRVRINEQLSVHIGSANANTSTTTGGATGNSNSNAGGKSMLTLILGSSSEHRSSFDISPA